MECRRPTLRAGKRINKSAHADSRQRRPRSQAGAAASSAAEAVACVANHPLRLPPSIEAWTRIE